MNRTYFDKSPVEDHVRVVAVSVGLWALLVAMAPAWSLVLLGAFGSLYVAVTYVADRKVRGFVQSLPLGMLAAVAMSLDALILAAIAGGFGPALAFAGPFAVPANIALVAMLGRKAGILTRLADDAENLGFLLGLIAVVASALLLGE